MRADWIIGAVVAAIAVYAVGVYNRLVRQRNVVREGWSGIDVQLKRRTDLIPNLVETVKGYAKQETTIFTAIADARARIGSGQPAQSQMQASNDLSNAISRLLVIVENYPQLKSSENFMRLQDELAGTENRLAVERMRYNETVQAYNTHLRQFPSNLVASAFNFEAKPLFEAPASAKVAPKVQF
jgi:LemA protein